MIKKFKTVLLTLVTILMVSTIPACSQDDIFNYGGQSIVSMLTVPTDSAESERVRVWLPLDRRTNCRTIVTINDMNGKKIKTFLDEMMPGGYHNFYWDKRDDSGQWVPAGQYSYKIADCEIQHEGKLTVVYGPDETDCLIYGPKADGDLNMGFELLRDSMKVSLAILNQRGRKIQEIFVDSIMTKGQHKYTWQPGKRIAQGMFQFEVKAGEASHAVFMTYQKSK